MPKPCSLELRERVVEAIASGASRREAAEWFAGEFEFGHQMDVCSRKRKYSPQAERGQHLAPGGTRGLFAGVDCRPTGFDAG